jgi:hypothetical protein
MSVVSITRRKRQSAAAGLNWYHPKASETVDHFLDDKYAPMGGPTVNPTAKAIPTQAYYIRMSKF